MTDHFNISDLPNVIDTAHQRIHAGLSFEVGYYNSSVGNTSAITILVNVGARPLHVIFDMAAGGDATFQITKGVSVTGSGTSLSIFNKNDQSSNVSSATAYHSPTGTSGGTAGPTIFIPGGGVILSSGGQDGGYNREKIFQINTAYLITLTNISGGAQPMSLLLEWYEPI